MVKQSHEMVGLDGNLCPEDEIQTPPKNLKQRKYKHADDSIKVFCEGDSIFMRMFASFINSKLSKTE